jgi:cell division protein FtsW
LGLLAYDGASFADVAKSQLVFGLGGGLLALIVALRTPYRVWRRFSLYLFGASVILTLLVFVPHVGVSINGARRWIDIGPITLQPSEALKIAYVLYLATWLSGAKNKISDWRYGLIPFGTITGIAILPVLVQPDTGTALLIAGTGVAMFIASGAKLRDFLLIAVMGIACLAALVAVRPYLADRLLTFIHPGNDAQGTGYHIQQSLLAIGAGEITGRGFGQSIQKFGKVPEPISDSIFSVFSEEFGFMGAAALVLIYLTLAMRGLWVAARSPDMFGGLLAVGIVVLIAGQSFVNIGTMLGVFPLSGLPLVFISHGGSALMADLGAAGILLAVSRSVKA